MFSATTFDSVGFNCPSDEIKTTSNASLQTSDVVVNDNAEQSRELHDKKIQCEPNFDNKQAVYDESRLLRFLNKVTGPLLKELDKVERSKAFTAPNFIPEDDLLEEEVKNLYTLKGQSLPEVKVSCLSWSSTGNVIALGYEYQAHEGWCTHESMVNFYNISSYKFDGQKVTNSIKTDSCVTCLAMHPHEPSVVALGTYSGDIEVWSVGKDNRTDGGYMSKNQYHEDRVTEISWANDSALQLVLVSSSLDGRMCVLKYTSTGDTQLMHKYILDPVSSDVLKPGVLCFSFCPYQPGIFVAGLESGQLLLCSAVGHNKMSSTKCIESCPVLRPVHKKTSPIIWVRFSPHEEHVFLAIALDFKLTLYSLKQDVPLLDIHSDHDIVGANWSLVDKNAIITWGSSSKLLVFNQKTGDLLKQLNPKDESLPKNMKYLKGLLNIKSTKLMSLADAEGNAYIWSIPTSFKK